MMAWAAIFAAIFNGVFLAKVEGDADEVLNGFISTQIGPMNTDAYVDDLGVSKKSAENIDGVLRAFVGGLHVFSGWCDAIATAWTKFFCRSCIPPVFADYISVPAGRCPAAFTDDQFFCAEALYFLDAFSVHIIFAIDKEA